jgi:hypothetical protein
MPFDINKSTGYDIAEDILCRYAFSVRIYRLIDTFIINYKIVLLHKFKPEPDYKTSPFLVTDTSI